MITLGAVAASLYAEVTAARSKDQLVEIERCVWQGEHARQRITDDEAQFLSDTITRMKGTGATARAVGTVVARLGSRFATRQRPRCPNRAAARARRRLLGGSSALPDTLRQHYTEGQRAVLCIVAGEVKAKGRCDLPIVQICALAGVCRTTVQTTLHEARRLGHINIIERPQPGRKSLTNIIDVVSAEWAAWIKRGPRRLALDRVQIANAAQKSEPHEELRVIEDARRNAPQTESSPTGGRAGRPAARKGDGVSPFTLDAGAATPPRPGDRAASSLVDVPNISRGVVSDFRPFQGTGAGRNARYGG